MQANIPAKESMHFDVIIVGAGPAGLATAIRLAQLAKAANTNLEICILEKGAEVGAHILSGAVLEPTALNELLPDWQTMSAPITTKAVHDSFYYLTKTKSVLLPTPAPMQNHGNYIISLSQVCRWLGTIAESLGIQIFPGFAATEAMFNPHGEVIGVTTGDQGISKLGVHKNNYQPGMDLFAKYTILAEGCRGSLSQQLIKTFNLAADSAPQTYALGIKELWEIPPAQHKAGHVIHTVGWPLDHSTYGGSFIYYLQPNYLALGFAIGLDYANPYLNPFAELQRFKHHPKIQPLLKDGKRIAYGARCINEGGLQSMPKLTFPGGMLVGCSAGFLNVPKIKGIHTAMKSGMLAAEAMFQELDTSPKSQETTGSSTALPELSTSSRKQETTRSTAATVYEKNIRNSWIWKELTSVRNIRPAFRFGFWPGMAYAALDTYVFRGHAPWTFTHHPDHTATKAANTCQPIEYPKPDNIISFDILSSVKLANTYHDEDQPVHLKLTNPSVAIDINLTIYAAPEQRFCPAQVYEIVTLDNQPPKLQINAQNCIHCKACDIKDPTQNITWTPPEGGGGPNYTNM